MPATATRPKRPKRDDSMPYLATSQLHPEAPPPVLIDVDRIEPHPDNPRDTFGDAELQQLAASLQSIKLLEPVTVQLLDDMSERYQLLSGERRWRAAKLAGWRTIPAFVRRVSSAAAAEILATANLERQDLNPLEKCRALALLCRPVAQGGAGKTQEAVSKQYGHSPSWCAQLLRVLRLPEVWQAKLAAGEITLREAKYAASYADRPDVLAAIELDRQRNPADWRTSDDFERQTKALAERLERLAAAGDDAAAGQGVPGNAAPVGAAAAAIGSLPLARRSAPVDHGGNDGQAAGNGHAGADPRGAIAAEPLDRDELLADVLALLERCNEYDLAEVKRYLTNLLGA